MTLIVNNNGQLCVSQAICPRCTVISWDCFDFCHTKWIKWFRRQFELLTWLFVGLSNSWTQLLRHGHVNLFPHDVKGIRLRFCEVVCANCEDEDCMWHHLWTLSDFSHIFFLALVRLPLMHRLSLFVQNHHFIIHCYNK